VTKFKKMMKSGEDSESEKKNFYFLFVSGGLLLSNFNAPSNPQLTVLERGI